VKRNELTAGVAAQRWRASASLLMSVCVLTAMASCGGAPDGARALSATGSPAAVDVASVPANVQPAPPPSSQAVAKGPTFELVGTSITRTSSFAILKDHEQHLLKVSQGDDAQGFIVARIESDRVSVRSLGDGHEFVVLKGLTDSVAPAAGSAASAAPASLSRLITVGVNVDQSIPAAITWGPTGFDPNNGRQMGH